MRGIGQQRILVVSLKSCQSKALSMTPAKTYKEAAKRIDAIEAEMRRIGAWQAQRPPEEAFQ